MNALLRTFTSPRNNVGPFISSCNGAVLAGYLGHSVFAGGGMEMKEFWGNALIYTPNAFGA